MPNFNYTFHFSFFTFFSVFLVSAIMLRIFIIFQVSYTLLEVLFPFLRRALYNTWKSHYRQLQVLILIFNKKALMKIPSISNSKNPPWNLLSFVSKTNVNECHRNSVRICFSLCFHNIARPVKSRCVIQTLIQNRIKHPRWSVLRKQLMKFFRYFSLCHHMSSMT